MTDSTPSDDAPAPLPDRPKPDAFRWTAEPEEPDLAGMPAEFANNEPTDGVPGVRRKDDRGDAPEEFNQESKN